MKFTLTIILMLSMCIIQAQDQFSKIINSYPNKLRLNQNDPQSGIYLSSNYIMKMDTNANLIWQRWVVQDSASGVSVNEVVPTDSGIFALQYQTSPELDQFSIFRIDLSGNFISSMTFKLNGIRVFPKYIEALDANILAVGLRDEEGFENILCVDFTGNILWQRRFKIDPNLWVYGVQAFDSHLFVYGSVSYGLNGGDIFVLKFNSQGEISWSKLFHAAGSNDIKKMIKKKESPNYYLIGSTTAGGRNMSITEIDTNGEVVKCRSYGSDLVDEGASAAYLSNGNLLLVGRQVSYVGGGGDCSLGGCYDLYAVLLNDSLDTLHTAMYGYKNYDWAYDVHALSEGRALILGYNQYFLSNNLMIVDSTLSFDCARYQPFTQTRNVIMTSNVISISYDSNEFESIPTGNYSTFDFENYRDSILCFSSPVIIDTVDSTISISKIYDNQLHIFPNPAKEKLSIDNRGELEIKQTRIMDATGRELWRSNANENSQNEIDLSSVATGLLLIEFSMEDGSRQVFRIIKE